MVNIVILRLLQLLHRGQINMTDTQNSSFVPESGKFYDPSELGINEGGQPPSKPPVPQANAIGNDWKPVTGKFYDPDELGISEENNKNVTGVTGVTDNKGEDKSNAEYEARVQKYMPEASKVLAPTSSLDYIPGMKQGFAALEAGVGSMLPVGEGATFSERYQNMMAKQDAYRRAKQQDEEARIKAQMPAVQSEYQSLSPSEQNANAAVTSFLNMPVVGPVRNKISAAIEAATGDQSSGKTFDERYLNKLATRQAAERLLAEKNPFSTLAGGIAQAPLLPGGGIGSAETVLGRLGEAAGTGATYGLADTASQGENPFLGAGIGAAGGTAGHALAGGLGMLGKKIGQSTEIGQRLFNPTNPERAIEGANKQYGKKYADELARAPKDENGNVIDPNFVTPEIMEKQRDMGQDVMGVDLGAGAMSRQARVESVGNPEFESALKGDLMQRHDEQKEVMGNVFKQLYGEEMDPVKLMNKAAETARQENAPNYKDVFGDPAGKDVWNEKLSNLTQSDDFNRFASEAKKKIQQDYISRNETPPKSPFFPEDLEESTAPTTPRTSEDITRESMGLKPKTNITDTIESTIDPNKPKVPISLENWDAVKRAADEAGRNGDKTAVQFANNLRSALGPDNLGNLGKRYIDTLSTAKKYFGQNDAFSAGMQLAKPTNPVKKQELLNNMNKYSPAEKDHNEKGYVSAKMDQIMNSTAPTSVTKMLDAPNQRAIFKTIVKPENQGPIEGTLRMQNVMNKVKQSILNQSTTAHNLMDKAKGVLKGPVGTGLGLAAVEGGSEIYHAFEGDEDTGGHLKALAYGAGAALLAHRYSQYTGAVSKEMQKLLMSRDPKALQAAIDSVAKKPEGVQFLRKMDQATSRSMGSINNFVKNYLSSSYQNPQDQRQGHKDGGSIKGKTRDLYKEIIAGMKAHKKATKHTLNKHDNEIASSLQQVSQKVTNADPIHN